MAISDIPGFLAILFLVGSVLAAAGVLIYSIIGPFFIKSNVVNRPPSTRSTAAPNDAQTAASLEDDADEDELHR
jgi:uncharacterized protein (UPF0333 family)